MPHSDLRSVIRVEDESLVRMFLADALDEAVNADEAITLPQARADIQAGVTDIKMPGSFNGIRLAWAARERWPGTGLVVTSGRVRPSPGDLPMDVASLTKPYLLETIINVMWQIVNPQVVEAACPSTVQSR